MLGFLKMIFGGDSGTVGAIERIASEAIETQMETAEANALMVKTLDPNGAMRRDLTRFACRAYGFYLVIACTLIVMHFFGIGDITASKESLDAIKELFLPITTAWGTIVGTSYGVNVSNNWQGS